MPRCEVEVGTVKERIGGKGGKGRESEDKARRRGVREKGKKRKREEEVVWTEEECTLVLCGVVW